MNNFTATVLSVVVWSVLTCSTAQAVQTESAPKVKVNLTAIRWIFQESHQLVFSGSPSYGIIYGAHETLATELARSYFPGEALAMIFNLSGFSRARLLQIAQINFTPSPCVDWRNNNENEAEASEFTLTVDLQDRVVNILPYTFFGPQNLAENIVWGAGFIEYHQSMVQEKLKAWMAEYLRQCNQLELRRIRLVHNFHDNVADNVYLSPQFKVELLHYLSYRKLELLATAAVMEDWNKTLPEERVVRSHRNIVQRLARLTEIDFTSSYNFNAELAIADREFLAGDIIHMSSSDNSFYCNTLENMNAMFADGDYASLYSLCLGHFFSLTTMNFGHICPGYNAFRQQWIAAGMNSNTADEPVTTGDFELIFTELPKPVTSLYKLYSITGMN